MSTQQLKKGLRKELRERLLSVTEAEHEKLRDQLRGWLSGQSGIWGAFSPLPGEPNLRPLWSELKGLRWAFPRIEEDRLIFHEPETRFVKGAFGIEEPHHETPVVKLESISGLLIPGLGFDRSGKRIGRGKGFYDRLLQNWTGLKVGVCFECQWVDRIPAESHDQEMDIIVTEAGPWRPAGKGSKWN